MASAGDPKIPIPNPEVCASLTHPLARVSRRHHVVHVHGEDGAPPNAEGDEVLV